MRAISRTISMGLLSVGFVAVMLAGSSAAGAATYGPTPCTPTVSINPTTIARGQSFTVTIAGNCFSQSFTIQIHSTTVTLGTVNTNASGAGTGTFTVPTNLPDGTHTVSVGNSIGDTATVTIAVSGGPFTGTTGTGSSGLPLTGTVVYRSVAAGAVFIALGGMLVLTARRRRARGFA